MALTKVAGFAVVLLFLCYHLQNQDYWQSVTSFFEDQLNSNTLHHNERARREASVKATEFTFEMTIGYSDMNTLQEFLKSLNLSLINSSSEIISSETTTECTSDLTEYQCLCQENYAWSYNTCVSHGACNGSNTGDTCGCIKGRPKNNEYCQLNLSSTALPTSPTTAMTAAPTTAMTPGPTTAMTPGPTTAMTPGPTTAMTAAPTTAMTPGPTTAMTAAPTTAMTPGPTTAMTPGPTTAMTAGPTTAMTAASTPQTQQLTFTMDLDFKDSFNNKNSQEYIDVSGAIQQKCGQLCSLTDLKFSSGSTIADYTISAPKITTTLVSAVKTGVFSNLVAKYPVIFDSDELINIKVFVLRRVTVECTVPTELDFGPKLDQEWKLNGSTINKGPTYGIIPDKLTVSTFTQPGNVTVECRRRSGNKIFRRTGVIVVKETPRIQVSPVQRLLKCGDSLTLECAVQDPYTVTFEGLNSPVPAKEIKYTYKVPDICDNSPKQVIYKCVSELDFKAEINLEITTKQFDCLGDPTFGDGYIGFIAKASCDPGKVGEITAECMGDKKFGNVQKNCVLKAVQDLLDQSGGLNSDNLPQFLDKLKGVAVNSSQDITNSAATIGAIVKIFGNVASKQLSFNKSLMENVLLTTDVLTSDDAKESWQILNKNDSKNLNTSNQIISRSSSSLLESLENISKVVQGDPFSIVTPLILFNKTSFSDNFNADFNSSVVVDIQIPGVTNLTVITFSSLDNVLLPRYLDVNDSSKTINGKIALIQSSSRVSNISLTFDVFNDTLRKPICVFWNFSLFNGLGGWDDEGCFLVSDENGTVSCSCNHLTSFSILMSPSVFDDPALDIITYAGVTISMVSLIICLIIEAIVWKEIRKNGTSLLRHVCIVNIALSLLIADIWFIIMAASIKRGGDNGPICTAVTFFNHFFYLAMFFWMLDSALLLLFRTMSVFGSGLSDMALLGIGFALGYGAPLIIASITIASTAGEKKYIQGCWLQWEDSRALLAFIIPVLVIILTNFIILIVVLHKIFRSRAQAAQSGDKHILLVIAKSVAVLTPMFGLTWGLGIGLLVDPTNKGIHYSFAFFNSLQGFFILVFGTLLDKKVRSDLVKTSRSIFSGTTSTSNATSISGRLRNWRARRGAITGYHISSSGANNTQSFSNT